MVACSACSCASRSGAVRPSQNATSQIDSYDIFNASLILSEVPLGDMSMQFGLWGRNITDEDNILGFIDFNNNTGFVNEPRVFGIEVSKGFGE